MRILFFLATLTLLSSVSALSKENEYFLNLSTETYVLTEHKYYSIYNNVYGIYRNYMGELFGKAIHLFPSRKFAIQEYCDICIPETIASGYFSYKGDDIIFNYEFIKEGKSDIVNEIGVMNAFTGVIDMGDYVTGDLFILVGHEKIDKLNKEKPFFDFYKKTVPYLEWGVIQKEVINE